MNDTLSDPNAPAEPKRASEEARALLRGAIDVHVHAGPDPYTERRLDARVLVRQAQEAGMAGLVLKSHEYPTQPLAWALDREFEGIRVRGALALDHAVGGLNPAAVAVSLRIGASVIWMPTFDTAHWRTYRPGHRSNDLAGITVLDEEGALLPVCEQILDLIGEHDAVLASGHLSVAETETLVGAARGRGIRSVVTHASFWIPTAVQVALADEGAYIEQCAVATYGAGGEERLAAIVEQVRAVGVERVVLSTDLGQAQNPDPPEGFAMWIDRFLEAGFGADDVASMVRSNPGELLG